mgnify:CR=1 FL=1
MDHAPFFDAQSVFVEKPIATVLVVDDTPDNLSLMGGLLRDHYHVKVANQGENLLAPLRAAVGPMVFGNAYAQKHTRITTCTLGYRAGVIGAALLAKNQG